MLLSENYVLQKISRNINENLTLEATLRNSQNILHYNQKINRNSQLFYNNNNDGSLPIAPKMIFSYTNCVQGF